MLFSALFLPLVYGRGEAAIVSGCEVGGERGILVLRKWGTEKGKVLQTGKNLNCFKPNSPLFKNIKFLYYQMKLWRFFQ